MNRTADERERRLAQLKREAMRRDFDRHASLLRDISELPVEFRTPAVLDYIARERVYPIILFPPQIRRGWDYVPRQVLLFAQTGFLHLLGSIWVDEEPQCTCFRAGDLLYMEISLLLLYGYMEVVAQSQGSPLRIGVEFNTVAWPLLSTPLRNLLQANHVNCSRTEPPELEHLPVKFSNGAKIYGLLGGESLEELVFQPGTSMRWLRFFRKALTAGTLLLLTSHYLVVIREELNVPQGWILTYIPRECITEILDQPCDRYHELVFRLERLDQTAQYKLRLAADAVEAWRLCWARQGGAWKALPLPVETESKLGS